ncbi:MAG: glycine cleavage system protein H, partial [Betaproteobacteria bacterium]|nr:glycine cleavage system protein H [Betaproteobacteria bacterium]
GRKLKQKEECAVAESVKAAADVYSPISGEVIEVNSPLVDEPGKINEDAYSAWLFKMKPSNTAEIDAMLDAAAYTELVENENH